MRTMRFPKAARLALALGAMAAMGGVAAAAPTVTVELGQDAGSVSPQMTGIFFEDINFGADGGLYPELVENRSFEFQKSLMGWEVVQRGGAEGRALPIRNTARPRNPHFLRVSVEKPGGGFALLNKGFRGMGVRAGEKLRFSVEARNHAPGITGLRAELIGADGKTLGEGRVGPFGDAWKSDECELTSAATDPKASLRVWVEGTGAVDLDMVSLFPEDTWKGRPNGLRKDLVGLLAAMKPGFLRFPGGCIVEGFDLPRRYQWKNTVGPLDTRVSEINRWNTEFSHKLTPDYYQSFGLGFYEYFQLCEDLGAEPMPILNCGMACQFNSGEVTPMSELDPFVQDALDLIEFANGPADSKWGKLRAEMGHPEPFGMKMLGVGNEQWGPQYVERYKVFAKAIKAEDPDIKLIAATGSDPNIFPNGQAEVAYLLGQWNELKPDYIDEHFYRAPEWFLQNANLYDRYDRSAPKIFVGEYAAQSAGVGNADNKNTWKCALYEAAFMTGLERNADVVRMSCYAPLFGNLDAWQWTPDMIWFNSLESFGTANYQVQKLFSLNTGDRLLRAKVADAPRVVGAQGIVASATRDSESGETIVKLVNATGEAQQTTLALDGAANLGTSAKMIVLASGSLDDMNTLAAPGKIVPVEKTIAIDPPQFPVELAPYSVTVLRIPAQ